MHETEGDQKMGEGVNRVQLLGNLGADPELRVTPGGAAVLNMRMATTERFVDKNNERQERTEWHRVTLWGKRGEALSKFLKKGDSLFVEGSIRTNTYEKDGEKKFSTEIVANNVVLTGGGAKTGGADGGVKRAQRPAPETDGPQTQHEEIPF
jgi:single-strand DNA-binding protein